MTRVFLAAGVAALAISAPAAAGPHGGGGGPNGGGHGKGGGAPAYVNQSGGGEHAHAQGGRGGGGGGAFRMQSFNGGGGGGGHGHGGGGNAVRMQAFNGGGGGHGHGGDFQMQARGGGHGNAHAMRAQQQQRQQARGNVARTQERIAVREQGHGNRAQAQNRMAFRQQDQNHAQGLNRQQQRANEQAQRTHGNGMNQNRFAQQQQVVVNRVNGRAAIVAENARGIGYGVGGCPPGLSGKGCMPPGQTLKALRSANADVFRASSIGLLSPGIIGPVQAAGFVGTPLATVGNYVPLAALPSSVSYLYPDTSDYYYRYGDGYLYQVNRGDNLVASLFPLLAGGYLPGTYLPQPYMASYVPDYYGLSSFYPASYGAYGYPYANYGYNGGYNYNNICSRYAYGVVYQVDCYTGMVINVIPTYAGGYGVGQMIPSAYSYYNVPMQYRDLYYPTADYSYWYAPGAIYQYDTGSSLITSVAALMSPGFAVGQPLPVGYGAYNVPYAYRATYYDTPNAWYRYNNGYIYQVDPATQLVTAVVASLLT